MMDKYRYFRVDVLAVKYIWKIELHTLKKRETIVQCRKLSSWNAETVNYTFRSGLILNSTYILDQGISFRVIKRAAEAA